MYVYVHVRMRLSSSACVRAAWYLCVWLIALKEPYDISLNTNPNWLEFFLYLSTKWEEMGSGLKDN